MHALKVTHPVRFIPAAARFVRVNSADGLLKKFKTRCAVSGLAFQSVDLRPHAPADCVQVSCFGFSFPKCESCAHEAAPNGATARPLADLMCDALGLAGLACVERAELHFGVHAAPETLVSSVAVPVGQDASVSGGHSQSAMQRAGLMCLAALMSGRDSCSVTGVCLCD